MGGIRIGGFCFYLRFCFWDCRLKGRAERVGRWFWREGLKGYWEGFAGSCFAHYYVLSM